MEEKKTKEIKMEPVKGQQKLSYDELNQACMELSQQNQQMQQYINKLYGQIRQMDQSNMFKRLDYLFMVLQHSTMFDADFVGDCISEIKEAITIPETEENPEEPKKE